MEGSGILSECLTYFLHRFAFYVLLEKLRRLAKRERRVPLMKTADRITNNLWGYFYENGSSGLIWIQEQ